MSEFESPDPPVFRVRCKDCTQFAVCPCGEHAYCTAYEEWTHPDEVVTVNDSCDYFEPAYSFDPNWDKTEPDYIPAWEADGQ